MEFSDRIHDAAVAPDLSEPAADGAGLIEIYVICYEHAPIGRLIFDSIDWLFQIITVRELASN